MKSKFFQINHTLFLTVECPMRAFLDERCNCIPKFGYCHNILSVCLADPMSSVISGEILFFYMVFRMERKSMTLSGPECQFSVCTVVCLTSDTRLHFDKMAEARISRFSLKSRNTLSFCAVSSTTTFAGNPRQKVSRIVVLLTSVSGVGMDYTVSGKRCRFIFHYNSRISFDFYNFCHLYHWKQE